MTKVIQYTGGSDTRTFSASDLKTLGVEEGAKKVTFNAGEPTQLDDAVADALLETHGYEFSLVEDPSRQQEKSQEKADQLEPPSDEEAKGNAGGTDQESTGAAVTGRGRGARSTAGA